VFGGLVVGLLCDTQIGVCCFRLDLEVGFVGDVLWCVATSQLSLFGLASCGWWLCWVVVLRGARRFGCWPCMG